MPLPGRPVVLMDLQMPRLDGPAAAARGESVLSPSVATRLLGRMRAPAEEALSPRELDIFAAVTVALERGIIRLPG